MSRILAIASGKGGAGKTSVAVNLAFALARAGRRVCLLDADLGLSNVDILLGLTPRHTLEEVLFDDLPMEAAITPAGPGVDVVAGSSGMSRMAELSRGRRAKLAGQFGKLSAYHHILVDNSPGISRQVAALCLACQDVLVVVNPEAPSMTDAYALIKVLKENGLCRSPALVVNRAESQAQAADVVARMRAACAKHLRLGVGSLGFLPRDPAVPLSAARQRPLLDAAPAAPAARAFLHLAAALERMQALDRQGQGQAEAFFEASVIRLLENAPNVSIPPAAPSPSATPVASAAPNSSVGEGTNSPADPAPAPPGDPVPAAAHNATPEAPANAAHNATPDAPAAASPEAPATPGAAAAGSALASPPAPAEAPGALFVSMPTPAASPAPDALPRAWKPAPDKTALPRLDQALALAARLGADEPLHVRRQLARELEAILRAARTATPPADRMAAPPADRMAAPPADRMDAGQSAGQADHAEYRPPADAHMALRADQHASPATSQDAGLHTDSASAPAPAGTADTGADALHALRHPYLAAATASPPGVEASGVRRPSMPPKREPSASPTAPLRPAGAAAGHGLAAAVASEADATAPLEVAVLCASQDMGDILEESLVQAGMHVRRPTLGGQSLAYGEAADVLVVHVGLGGRNLKSALDVASLRQAAPMVLVESFAGRGEAVTDFGVEVVPAPFRVEALVQAVRRQAAKALRASPEKPANLA